MWFWEIIDTIHKLLLTSILAFLPQTIQLPFGMSVVIMYVMLLLIFQPYLVISDDRLHLISQIEIFLIIFAGFLFQQAKAGETYEGMNDIYVSIALIMITILFFLAFVYCAGLILQEYITPWFKRWLGKDYRLKQLKKRSNKVAPANGVTVQ